MSLFDLSNEYNICNYDNLCHSYILKINGIYAIMIVFNMNGVFGIKMFDEVKIKCAFEVN